MTEQELTQAIRDYIKNWYKADYTGYLTVEKIKPTGYKMSIGLPHYMFPTTIASNHESDQEFLDFIYEEFRIRNYIREYRYKVVRLPNTREE